VLATTREATEGGRAVRADVDGRQHARQERLPRWLRWSRPSPVLAVRDVSPWVPIAMQIIEFTSDKRFVRRARALKTLETMVRMYCRGHGHDRSEALCSDCAALFDYARRRLERCVFGDAKPTCANCIVHCYKAGMREQIRIVMRWAGPRLMLRHPVMAVAHLVEERRPAPMLPAMTARRRRSADDTASRPMGPASCEDAKGSTR
jgi:hypothetical protein